GLAFDKQPVQARFAQLGGAHLDNLRRVSDQEVDGLLRALADNEDPTVANAALAEHFNTASMRGPEEALEALGIVAKRMGQRVDEAIGGVRRREESMRYVGRILGLEDDDDVLSRVAAIAHVTDKAGEYMYAAE